MTSAAQNELMTRVGPGTPAGALLRIVIQRRCGSVITERPLEHVVLDDRKHAVQILGGHLSQGRVKIAGQRQGRGGLHQHDDVCLLCFGMVLEHVDDHRLGGGFVRRRPGSTGLPRGFGMFPS